MTYADLINTFCEMFNLSEEHVEKVLQKTLDEKGINSTPQKYYEDALEDALKENGLE